MLSVQTLLPDEKQNQALLPMNSLRVGQLYFEIIDHENIQERVHR